MPPERARPVVAEGDGAALAQELDDLDADLGEEEAEDAPRARAEGRHDDVVGHGEGQEEVAQRGEAPLGASHLEKGCGRDGGAWGRARGGGCGAALVSLTGGECGSERILEEEERESDHSTVVALVSSTQSPGELAGEDQRSCRD